MSELPPFVPYRSIPRLNREMVVTEKLDGTNAVIYIGEDGQFIPGSRSRWLVNGDDNHGFARWAYEHKDELLKLGPGWHHGEWWGKGINRTYGLAEKRFSLFNTSRWTDETKPAICHVVPTIFTGHFSTRLIGGAIDMLRNGGSWAAPGYMRPEGVVVYHVQGNLQFKVTLEHDEVPKGLVKCQ